MDRSLILKGKGVCMGTKLNPDGIKIRILRVQRGWTQEQLAEIAGISLRTIQRAEAASSAAFETIRAIATAFETEFNQLIKHDFCGTANQGMQTESNLPMSSPDPEFERIVVAQPGVAARRSWATPIIAVSTLTGGFVTKAGASIKRAF